MGYTDTVGDTVAKNSKKKLPLRQYVQVEVDGGNTFATYVVKVLRPQADGTPSPNRTKEFVFSEDELMDLLPEGALKSTFIGAFELICAMGKLNAHRVNLMRELETMVDKTGGSIEDILDNFESNDKYLWRIEAIAKIESLHRLISSRYVGFDQGQGVGILRTNSYQLGDW